MVMILIVMWACIIAVFDSSKIDTCYNGCVSCLIPKDKRNAEKNKGVCFPCITTGASIDGDLSEAIGLCIIYGDELGDHTCTSMVESGLPCRCKCNS